MKRTILITGAGSGFGKGVALGLARAGHDVIAGCHIWPQVTNLRAEADRAGLSLRVIKLDVLSEIDRNHALAMEFDTLFNNAGIMESGPVAELPMEIVRASFETNVFAALAMAQGAARRFIKAGKGRIVWTSSVAGLVGVSWDGAYSASKFAVEGFCLAMREELKPYGVEVCTVNPGAYRTGFNDTGMEAQDQWWDQGERVMEHWPVRELKNQFDPAEMVEAMIRVLTDKQPPFRTVLPTKVADRVRDEQTQAWNWTTCPASLHLWRSGPDPSFVGPWRAMEGYGVAIVLIRIPHRPPLDRRLCDIAAYNRRSPHNIFSCCALSPADSPP